MSDGQFGTEFPSAFPWEWKSTSSFNTDSDRSLHKVGSFDESWYQGRGVYGGLTAAVILQSMMDLEPNRTPRSFTLHCAAPIFKGSHQVIAQCERRGSKVSHLSARLSSVGSVSNDDKQSIPGDMHDVLAFASASFGAPRRFTEERVAEQAPTVSPVESVMELPLNTPMMPPFCQHFRYRFCWDALPYTRQADAFIGGWCELRNPLLISYPYIAAILDAWAPALFPTLKAPMRAASVDFSYHFLCTPEQLSKLTTPFLYRGEVLSLYQGYAEERNWLWDATGIPVATARQLYAIS